MSVIENNLSYFPNNRQQNRSRGQFGLIEDNLAKVPNTEIYQPQFSVVGSMRFNQESLVNKRIVGFGAAKEVEAVQKNYQRGLKDGKSKWEAFNDAFKETEQNIKTWRVEYTKKHYEVRAADVFVGSYDIKVVNGEETIVDKSGYPVEDKMDEIERQGKVKSSWIEGKKKLILGRDGGMWVVVSSEGPTGLRDEEGDKIDFPDSYVQIAIRQGKEIKFVTFRTSLNIPESRKLLVQLIDTHSLDVKIPPVSRDTYTEVSNLVGTGLYIKGESLETAQKSSAIAKHILKVNPYAFGGKSLQKIDQEIAQMDEKFQVDIVTQGYIDGYREFLFNQMDYLDNDFTKKRIGQEIRNVLIKVMLNAQGRKPGGLNGTLSKADINWGMKEMQTYTGCAGNGKKNIVNLIPGFGVIRLGISEGIEISGSKEECSKCRLVKESIVCGWCKECAA